MGIKSQSHHHFRRRGGGVVIAPGPFIAAVHSRLVVESFGMNVQPWQTNNYTDYTRVEAFLVDLGVKLLRTKLVPTVADPSNVWMNKMFTDHNMKWHATIGAYDPGDSLAARAAERVALEPCMLAYAPAFEGFGSYNEPNGVRIGPLNPAWRSICATHQQWMFNYRAANGTLSNVIVCGPSLHDVPPGGNVQLAQDYLDLAPCAPYMDRIEMHRYPAGQVPSTGIDQRTQWAVAGVGSKLVTVSETGYNITPLTWSARVTANVQGSYIANLFMEHVLRGNKMMWFDLLCQYDPTQTSNQDWYGIISAPTNNNADLTTLKAFATMKRFLAHLEDGPTAFVTSPLQVTKTGDTSIKSYLTQKRDGTYRLMLWRDAKLWNKSTHTEVAVASVNATLTFPSSKSITRYTPAVGAAGTVTTGTVHTIPVAGDCVIVSI